MDKDDWGCLFQGLVVIAFMVVIIGGFLIFIDQSLTNIGKWENNYQLVHTTCYSGELLILDEPLYQSKGSLFGISYTKLDHTPITLAGNCISTVIPQVTVK